MSLPSTCRIPEAPVEFHFALLARNLKFVTNEGKEEIVPSQIWGSGFDISSNACIPVLVAKFNARPEANKSWIGSVEVGGAGSRIEDTAVARAFIARVSAVDCGPFMLKSLVRLRRNTR